MGDHVDNIPGVPGVGPKTAVKWLQEYGSLDQVVAHAGDIKGKVGDSLRASLSQLSLAQELATIHCAVDLPLQQHDLARQPADTDRLRALFERMAFKTWRRELGDVAVTRPAAPTPPSINQAQYRLILHREDFIWLLAQIQQAAVPISSMNSVYVIDGTQRVELKQRVEFHEL